MLGVLRVDVLDVLLSWSFTGNGRQNAPLKDLPDVHGNVILALRISVAIEGKVPCCILDFFLDDDNKDAQELLHGDLAQKMGCSGSLEPLSETKLEWGKGMRVEWLEEPCHSCWHNDDIDAIVPEELDEVWLDVNAGCV